MCSSHVANQASLLGLINIESLLQSISSDDIWLTWQHNEAKQLLMLLDFQSFNEHVQFADPHNIP
jgi:hypothetical protein